MEVMIVFLEASKDFRRYDIIDRIIRVLRDIPSRVPDVFFIIIRKNYIEAIKCRRSFCSRTLLSLDTTWFIKIIYGLYSCSKLVVFSENADERIAELNGECLLLGLHTDVPDDIVYELEKQDIVVYRARLNKIPYMASQCVYIIAYISSIED